ncbi:glutaredoxin [Clostridium chromiireducens]|uniref:Glutaredoxin n=1 Tax=Clostridium chromiireducens TaxID=225345 RepID=A0A399IMU6_9CLOT|nr:glutaredoxin [Clostridium chromiireducens]RII34251.1 glutaredoxin [Clostridium chromiireducens]
MKITMYGTAICPDCVEVKVILEKHKDIELDYKNITESTKLLKEFLSYRDNDEMFTNVVKEGKIGIPFFVLEDGTKTLDIFDYLDIEKPKKAVNSCSIDGSGKC